MKKSLILDVLLVRAFLMAQKPRTNEAPNAIRATDFCSGIRATNFGEEFEAYTVGPLSGQGGWAVGRSCSIFAGRRSKKSFWVPIERHSTANQLTGIGAEPLLEQLAEVRRRGESQ